MGPYMLFKLPAHPNLIQYNKMVILTITTILISLNNPTNNPIPTRKNTITIAILHDYNNKRQQESIGSALKTRQSNTIKYRVTKIVPKRH